MAQAIGLGLPVSGASDYSKGSQSITPTPNYNIPPTQNGHVWAPTPTPLTPMPISQSKPAQSAAPTALYYNDPGYGTKAQAQNVIAQAAKMEVHPTLQSARSINASQEFISAYSSKPDMSQKVYPGSVMGSILGITKANTGIADDRGLEGAPMNKTEASRLVPMMKKESERIGLPAIDRFPYLRTEQQIVPIQTIAPVGIKTAGMLNAASALGVTARRGMEAIQPARVPSVMREFAKPAQPMMKMGQAIERPMVRPYNRAAMGGFVGDEVLSKLMPKMRNSTTGD